MKKNLLIIFMCILMVFMAVSCDEPHTHNYGEPTVEDSKVVKKCECGDTQLVENAIAISNATGFLEAVQAEETKDICLANDITLGTAENRQELMTFSKDLKIYLNGKTLKFIQVDKSHKILANVEFSNGKLDFEQATANSVNGSLYAAPGSKLILRDVELVSNASGIVPGGNIDWTAGTKGETKEKGATVIIDHSTVKAVIWPVATNNTYGTDFDIQIINGSTIIANANGEGIADKAKADDTGLMINNKGILKVEDSTIIGDRQVVIVRGGTASFKNVTLKMASEFKSGVTTWENGNNIPNGIMVVGNAGGTPYDVDLGSTVTLEGTIEIETPQDYNGNILVLAGKEKSHPVTLTTNGKLGDKDAVEKLVKIIGTNIEIDEVEYSEKNLNKKEK